MIKNNRPSSLEEFIGQENLKTNLKIAIKSSLVQKKPLSHILLYGGPGKGKTSLGKIISFEMKTNFRSTSGSLLQKTTDITSLFASIKENDVVFIDEIHAINHSLEEMFYTVMEDYMMDLIIGEGSSAKIVKISIPPFTLICATTKYGQLSEPFRHRFNLTFRLEDYNISELSKIIKNFFFRNNIKVKEEDLFYEIAIRSKNTPRLALTLSSRILDFFYGENHKLLDKELVIKSTKIIGIDNKGLNILDLSYLKLFIKYNVLGIETISGYLQESINTIEETIEPYLMRINFIKKTPRGRVLTEEGLKHIKNIII
ncbi:Holliday junction DNA helicase RuvB [Rickettsiales bacterium (ex Bugula neritina AB1)]|nr:Holliday junction DNA helicase RuvB [Rickettsiales bacterium (ex Bugula neritina AB1)]